MAELSSTIKVIIDTSNANSNQGQGGGGQRSPEAKGGSNIPALALGFYVGSQREAGRSGRSVQDFKDMAKISEGHWQKQADSYREALRKSILSKNESLMDKTIPFWKHQNLSKAVDMKLVLAQPELQGKFYGEGDMEDAQAWWNKVQTRHVPLAPPFMKKLGQRNAYRDLWGAAGEAEQSVSTGIGNLKGLAMGGAKAAAYGYAAYKIADAVTNYSAFGLEALGRGSAGAVAGANFASNVNRAVNNLVNFAPALYDAEKTLNVIRKSRAIFGTSDTEDDPFAGLGVMWGLKRLQDRIEKDKERMADRLAYRGGYIPFMSGNRR